MWQLKDSQGYHRTVAFIAGCWRRHRHCDERSEPGTRGDSPWLFRNPLLNHRVADKPS